MQLRVTVDQVARRRSAPMVRFEGDDWRIPGDPDSRRLAAIAFRLAQKLAQKLAPLEESAAALTVAGQMDRATAWRLLHARPGAA